MIIPLLCGAVALVTVGVVLLVESIEPCAPHPDVTKIQWPCPPDRSITVERRDHDN